jgi:hypothetical protein
MDTASFDAGLRKAVDDATTHVGRLSSSMRQSSREGAESLRLIDEAIGLHLSRPLTRIVAQIPGVGSALQGLLGVGVFGALTVAGVEFGEKIAASIEKARKAQEELAESSQKVRETFQSTMEGYGNQSESLKAKIASLSAEQAGNPVLAASIREQAKETELLTRAIEEAKTKLNELDAASEKNMSDAVNATGLWTRFWAGVADRWNEAFSSQSSLDTEALQANFKTLKNDIDHAFDLDRLNKTHTVLDVINRDLFLAQEYLAEAEKNGNKASVAIENMAISFLTMAKSQATAAIANSNDEQKAQQMEAAAEAHKKAAEANERLIRSMEESARAANREADGLVKMLQAAMPAKDAITQLDDAFKKQLSGLRELSLLEGPVEAAKRLGMSIGDATEALRKFNLEKESTAQLDAYLQKGVPGAPPAQPTAPAIPPPGMLAATGTMLAPPPATSIALPTAPATPSPALIAPPPPPTPAALLIPPHPIPPPPTLLAPPAPPTPAALVVPSQPAAPQPALVGPPTPPTPAALVVPGQPAAPPPALLSPPVAPTPPALTIPPQPVAPSPALIAPSQAPTPAALVIPPQPVAPAPALIAPAQPPTPEALTIPAQPVTPSPALIAPPTPPTPAALTIPPPPVAPPPALLSPPAVPTPAALVIPPQPATPPPALIAPPQLATPAALVIPPQPVSPPPALVAPPAPTTPAALLIPPQPAAPPPTLIASATPASPASVEQAGLAAVGPPAPQAPFSPSTPFSFGPAPAPAAPPTPAATATTPSAPSPAPTLVSSTLPQLPQYGGSAAAGVATMQAAIDSFAHDTQAQTKLIGDAFTASLTPLDKYNLEVAKIKIAFEGLAPALQGTAAAQAAFDAEMRKASDELLKADDHIHKLQEDMQKLLERSTSAAAGFKAFTIGIQIQGSENGKFVFDILNDGLKGFEDNLVSMLEGGKAHWQDYFKQLEGMAMKFAINKTLGMIAGDIMTPRQGQGGPASVAAGGPGSLPGGGEGGGIGSTVSEIPRLALSMFTKNPMGEAASGVGATSLTTAGTTLTTAATMLQTAATSLQMGGAGAGGGGGFGNMLDLIPHAAGGDVTPGQGYMVGEEGPEPFFPKEAGTIMPNSAMGKTGTHHTYNIDARGADAGVEARIMRAVRVMSQQSEQRAVTTTEERSKRSRA